jgi:hypothetical protein
VGTVSEKSDPRAEARQRLLAAKKAMREKMQKNQASANEETVLVAEVWL